uniref:RING-CH-type domain-containing protein n=1 Tax=Timema cristinae TaxID=61476 RepID=A0A7R9GQI0_TIMCR|nr:unnamed protein product [Timema cristinae]
MQEVTESERPKDSQKGRLQEGICHCEGGIDTPLIAPCYCAGSLRYVHQACLQQWIKSSDIRSCELCKYQFIMHSKFKPFSEWEKLEMSNLECRKLMCSITFHIVALTCVIWSLYVLIERTAHEIRHGNIDWPLWTKIIVVAIGFTGALVFMYIQCKAYLHVCHRWRAFNRVIYIQNAPIKLVSSADTHLTHEECIFVPQTCCGSISLENTYRTKYRSRDSPSIVTLNSSLHENKTQSFSSKPDQKQSTVSLSAKDDNIKIHLELENPILMKRNCILDASKSYQTLSCKLDNETNSLRKQFKSTELETNKNASSEIDPSQKFSYSKSSLSLDNSYLNSSDYEERSCLLQNYARNLTGIVSRHQNSSIKIQCIPEATQLPSLAHSGVDVEDVNTQGSISFETA